VPFPDGAGLVSGVLRGAAVDGVAPARAVFVGVAEQDLPNALDHPSRHGAGMCQEQFYRLGGVAGITTGGG
jgi:hypothetical protein